MSDPLDQLQGLETKIRCEPETIPQLRNRVARRRRRRRALAAGSALLVVSLMVAGVVRDGDGGGTLHTVDGSDGGTSPTHEAGTTAVLPTGALISSESGIDQVAEGGLTRVSQEPTSLAFSVGDRRVVTQRAEVGDVYPPQPTGPILVLEDGVSRELDTGQGTEVRLHDAGVVDGRPMAIVTVRSGSTPEDTEEGLFLIDIETGVRTDLGIVGGWESGLSQARLAGAHVVTLLDAGAQSHLIVRSITGAVEWEGPDTVVDSFVSVAVIRDEVLLLEPSFQGADFQPNLGIHRYDLESGANLAPAETVALHPLAGTEIDAGFCFYAESSSGLLLCDQSSGGPLEIDAATGTTRPVEGVDAGRVTLPRAGVLGNSAAASQSDEAARRDGVVPELAAMPSSERIEPHERVDAPEGSWVLSRLTASARDAAASDSCIIGDPRGSYGTDFICADEYGEILLLDPRGEILRAYPMPSAMPSWIYLDDDAVLVGRIGDGGLPASTLVRIDRQTLASETIVFPQPDSEIQWPPGWHIASPDQAQAYASVVAVGPDAQGSLAVSETGRVAIDPSAINELFGNLG